MTISNIECRRYFIQNNESCSRFSTGPSELAEKQLVDLNSVGKYEKWFIFRSITQKMDSIFGRNFKPFFESVSMWEKNVQLFQECFCTLSMNIMQYSEIHQKSVETVRGIQPESCEMKRKRLLQRWNRKFQHLFNFARRKSHCLIDTRVGVHS